MQKRKFPILCLPVLAFACDAAEIGNSPPPAGGNPPTSQPTPPNGQQPTPPAVTPPVTMEPSTPVTPPGPVTPPAPVMPPATPPTDPPAPPVPPAAGPKGPFSCSLVIGIQATADWFNGGFETMVGGGDKWELLAVHSGFVNYWADPSNKVWGQKPSSACTMNAGNPDRVILTALYLHWMHASVEEWVNVLSTAVKNFKEKYSNLKNVELTTFVRSPGEKPCPGGMTFKSYIEPEQDQAYAMMPALFPGLVTVAPRTEVSSCADYGGNPPHLTGAGKANAAKKLAALYKEAE
jgi:hypothetical protein